MKELCKKIENILPSIHGWCNPVKAKKIVEIILKNKSDLCVEIGVFGGSSLVPTAMSLKFNGKGVVYGIDPWGKQEALEEMKAEINKKWWDKVDYEDIYNHCLDNIKKYDISNFCKIIRSKSEDAVSQFQDNSIDLLHIDGNHSEELSYKDAILYLPKVKTGGTILFDDIWWAEEDLITTRKAVVFLLKYCKKVEVIEDCLILEKN